MVEKIELEEMSWPEIKEAVEGGKDTAVVMVGSIEQHGPHLPIKTDAYIADELGRMITEKLGDALMAPTIRPGVSGHHMDFSGTISLSSDVLVGLLRDYCTSLDQHGFRFIVLISTHGGNFAPINTAAPEISSELENAELICISDLSKLMELMNRGMKDAGIDYEEPIIHSGAAETSVLLWLDETLVRRDKVAKGSEEEISTALLLSKGLKEFTDNGVLGDPRKATVEAGQRIMEILADNYTHRIIDERERLHD